MRTTSGRPAFVDRAGPRLVERALARWEHCSPVGQGYTRPDLQALWLQEGRGINDSGGSADCLCPLDRRLLRTTPGRQKAPTQGSTHSSGGVGRPLRGTIPPGRRCALHAAARCLELLVRHLRLGTDLHESRAFNRRDQSECASQWPSRSRVVLLHHSAESVSISSLWSRWALAWQKQSSRLASAICTARSAPHEWVTFCPRDSEGVARVVAVLQQRLHVLAWPRAFGTKLCPGPSQASLAYPTSTCILPSVGLQWLCPRSRSWLCLRVPG